MLVLQVAVEHCKYDSRELTVGQVGCDHNHHVIENMLRLER